jgi:hypothetical protein
MHITGARWGPRGAEAVIELRAMGFHSKDPARVHSGSERPVDISPGERGGFVLACYFDHVDRLFLIKSIELIKAASLNADPPPPPPVGDQVIPLASEPYSCCLLGDEER